MPLLWLFSHVLRFAVVVCLSFGRRDIAQRTHQTVVVEPRDPGQRGELEGLAGLPGLSVDHLGLVQAVDRLSQGVVVAVALATHRRLDSCLCQAFRVLNRNVLRPAIRAVNEAAVALGLPVDCIRCLLRSWRACIPSPCSGRVAIACSRAAVLR